MSIKKVSAEHYTIKFKDLALKDPTSIIIDKLQLSADDISTEKGSKGEISLALRLNNTGAAEIKGDFGIDPAMASLEVTLKDIAIKPLQSYFTDRVNIIVTNGKVSTEATLDIELAADREVTARFRGVARVSSASISSSTPCRRSAIRLYL